MTTWYDIEDIFEDIPGDPDNVLMKVPEDICRELQWEEHDLLNISLQEGQIVITKHG